MDRSVSLNVNGILAITIMYMYRLISVDHRSLTLFEIGQEVIKLIKSQ